MSCDPCREGIDWLAAFGSVKVEAAAEADGISEPETVDEAGFDPARVAAAETTRWVAMGEFYAKLAEAQRERAAEADVARWIAKGEFYAGLDAAGKSETALEACQGD